MKVIYIAGPFRGPTTWAVEQNVRRAECVGLEVARLGAMPLIPHTNTRYFDGELPDKFWIDGTLELLKRSDAVMLVRGWRKSVGALGEHAWAMENGTRVFEAIGELESWLRSEAEKPTR